MGLRVIAGRRACVLLAFAPATAARSAPGRRSACRPPRPHETPAPSRSAQSP